MVFAIDSWAVPSSRVGIKERMPLSNDQWLSRDQGQAAQAMPFWLKLTGQCTHYASIEFLMATPLDGQIVESNRSKRQERSRNAMS